MATYEEIYGKRVEVLDAEPTLTSAYEGQVWYNSASGTLKSVVKFDGWRSGGNLPAVVSANQGCGIQTAALSISGQPSGPGTAATNATNHYDGYGWTAGGTLAAGAASYSGVSATKGTQTAALYWDGYNPTPGPAGYRATVSSYDGSTWTAQPTFPGSPAGYSGGAGTQTAALSIGGYLVANCYESDGSYNWTSTGALPAAKYAMAAGGPQTAAIGAGGYGGSPVVLQSTADTYDGTSWTAITATPITQGLKNQGFGTDSSDFMVAGGAPNRTTCLKWDGSSWTTMAAITTGRQAGAGAGSTASSGLIAGGQSPFKTATEEYDNSINTITNAAWASAPATNTALGTTAGCGSVTAGLVFSGADNLTNSEKYDGTSWTATPALNVGRYGAGEATNAPQTAALCFGGVADPGTNNKDATEEWNGSSWSAQTALPVAMRQLAGFGIQTAAVTIGGYSTTYIAESYEYNGSSWTAGGDMNTSRERAAGCGLETAGLAMGGNNPSPYIANVEEYDGSSWTNATALSTANKLASAAGIQTDAIFFAGNVPPNNVVGTTLGYDGTSWSTRPSMGPGRQAGAGAGTSTAALMMAGANVGGTALTTVEEYTGDVETVTAKTLTTS